MTRAKRAVLPVALLTACGELCAQPSTFGPAGDDGGLVDVTLVADAGVIGPGKAFHLAVVFDIEPEWHIYWKNPGEGAMPPRIVVSAPDGFEVGDPLWPRPTAVRTPIGIEYCYLDETVLFIPVRAPKVVDDGRVTFQVDVHWAVCRNVCRLGSARRSVEVEARTRAPIACFWSQPVVVRHFARLPRRLDEVAGGQVLFENGVLTLSGPAEGRGTASFYPDASPGVSCGPPIVTVEDDRFRVEVMVTMNPANAVDGTMEIRGLVALGERSDDPCYDFQLPSPQR